MKTFPVVEGWPKSKSPLVGPIVSKWFLAGIVVSTFLSLGAASQPGELLFQEAAFYRSEGQRSQQAGKLKEALTAYQKAVLAYPAYADAYNDMGVIFESLGEDDKAEDAYQKALSLEPNLPGTHSNLALFYERKQNVQEAARHWASRVRLGESDDPWVIRARRKLIDYNLPVPKTQDELKEAQASQIYLAMESGRKQLRAKRWEEAIGEFERVLEIKPNHKEATRQLKEARNEWKLAQNRKPDKREKAAPAQKSVTPVESKPLPKPMEKKPAPGAAKPAHPKSAVETPAQMEREQGKIYSDAQALSAALAKEKWQVRKASVGDLYQRGVTAMRQRRFEEAVTYFQQVLNLDPNHKDAQSALKRAESALSKATQ